MKITKSRLKRIIKEELQNEMFGFGKKTELTPEEKQIISQDEEVSNLINQLRQEMENLGEKNKDKPGKIIFQLIWNMINPNSTGSKLKKLVQKKAEELRSKNGSNPSANNGDDSGINFDF